MDAVHSSCPFELILGFELFGDVFGFYHLGNKGVEHLPGFGVDLGAVLVEVALSEESCEEYGVMFL